MAKRKASHSRGEDLPGVGNESRGGYVATPPPKVEDKQEPKRNASTVREMEVGVPFLAGIEGYKRRRLDMKLNGSQAEKVRGIQMGLEASGAKLENGRFVSTPTHAVLWILENFS